ncbi:MAG: M23 family metallopeptidase [Pseudomonadota bacterium]
MTTAHNNLKNTSIADDAPKLLGELPALSTERGKSGPPDSKDVSLRWLAGTVLTGVTSITLMGGALLAAVDGQHTLAIPTEAIVAKIDPTTTAKVDAKSADLSVKGDRPLPVVPEVTEKQILRLSTLTRGIDGNRVRTRPFARVNSPLARRKGDPTFNIPPFDPVAIFSGSSKFREKGADEVLYGSQVDDEMEIRSVAFPVNFGYSQANQGFSDDEIEAEIRTRLPILRASLDDGSILAKAGAIAYVDPGRFAVKENAKEDPFAELGIVIRNENVSEVAKTSEIASLDDAGRETVITVAETRPIKSVIEQDARVLQGSDAIAGALLSQTGTADLDPSHKLKLAYASSAGDNQPDLVSLYNGRRHLATIARADDGQYVAIEEPRSVEVEEQPTEQFVSQGTSTYRAIFDTALKNDIPMQLARELIRIYAFDLDFRRPIKTSDEMEVFYSLDPEQEVASENSEILYTAISLGDTKRQYYRFKTTDDGVVDYYDENGRSAKKFLMRQPVPRARFVSGFGWRRHPILRTNRLHKGVDWAAKRGTPIFAAGNGVIEDAKWFSGYGRWIKVRHANGYKTAYAHLSRFAKGIKAGTRVRQGQVIGYVGSTGLSTGPHLHYEVIVNGRHVDPMRIRLPRGRVLNGEQLAAFEQERDRINKLLREADPSETQTAALNN